MLVGFLVFFLKCLNKLELKLVLLLRVGFEVCPALSRFSQRCWRGVKMLRAVQELQPRIPGLICGFLSATCCHWESYSGE